MNKEYPVDPGQSNLPKKGTTGKRRLWWWIYFFILAVMLLPSMSNRFSSGKEVTCLVLTGRKTIAE